ncbi:MAG: hypothetical protein LDL53_00925 [Candidatus Hydrogenedens sp.]|nr:hypothetical protein [Candidatus Hydrogenedens sp.]
MILASKWIDFLIRDTSERRQFLSEAYGVSGQSRIPLILNLMYRFIEIFGDQAVFIVRCPGRINLRGMHVDTHGGFLNLMTIEQEILLIGQIRDDDVFNLHNLETKHKPFQAKFRELLEKYPINSPWMEICQQAQNNTDATMHWHQFIRGILLRTAKQISTPLTTGINAVIGGDIPEGSALSSSHALCLTLLNAIMYITRLNFDETTKLKMVQDAEWFTGARSGLSDQTAELLGRRGFILGIRLHPITAEILEKEYLPFPEDVSIVITDSKMRRDISSTHAVSYIKNRFAYSVALKILAEIMKQQGFTQEELAQFQTLADFTPEKLGNKRLLYKLFRSIPSTLSVESLLHEFKIPDIQELYERYYGHLLEENRPREVSIRGPLVFGICESLRAKAFCEAIRQGNVSMAGYLMTLGHNGDRIIDSVGKPFHREVNDDILFVYDDLEIEPFSLPGDFGASTPVLDRIVDIANQHGALGSCLTGAGLGGVVLSLCMKKDVPAVKQALQDWLASEDYAKWAGTNEPLSLEVAKKSVYEHNSTQGAGILPAPYLSYVH